MLASLCKADRIHTHVLMQTEAGTPDASFLDPTVKVTTTFLPLQTIEHWTDHERLVKSGDHSVKPHEGWW